MPDRSPFSMIVDADTEHTLALRELLNELDMNPVHCSSLESAKEKLVEVGAGLAIAFVALDLPDGEGLELLRDEALFSPSTEVALMHDVDDPARANEGISLQACYFFCKPLDQNFLKNLISDIKEDWIADAQQHDEDPNCAIDQFGLLRGNSGSMRRLYRTIRKVAATKASVLLMGESGTGKELAAQTIHNMSNCDGPFVAINCGAISAELAESELFGHEKGSFSGADRQHSGCFERADGGTLFLDEIGEMPLDIQVKLLRVLETGKYRRVGGEKNIATDVRIVAATNRDPEEAIHEGLLREDLYFRIAQFPMRLPPLRDRGDDVLGLSQHFLNRLNESNSTGKSISVDTLDGIRRYPWPGNVRELKSAIERAYIMADQQLEAEHFPEAQVNLELEGDYLRVSVGGSLEDAERKLILATLDAADGDKKQAAEQLGISLKTLYNRLNEYAEK